MKSSFRVMAFVRWGNGHDFVILSFAGFSQQEVCDCISFFDGDCFAGSFFHSFVVFLDVADIGQCEECAGDMGLHHCHFFQNFASLFCFSHWDIELAEVTHCLEVLFDGKCLGEAFYGIIRTSHALCAQAVIFEYFEVFLIVLLFFTFRCFRLTGEKRFKKVRHGCVILEFVCKCNNLF